MMRPEEEGWRAVDREPTLKITDNGYGLNFKLVERRMTKLLT